MEANPAFGKKKVRDGVTAGIIPADRFQSGPRVLVGHADLTGVFPIRRKLLQNAEVGVEEDALPWIGHPDDSNLLWDVLVFHLDELLERDINRSPHRGHQREKEADGGDRFHGWD